MREDLRLNGLIDLETVRKYANQAKSPFVGIPVVSDGSRPPAIFPRRIIQAAVEAPGHLIAYYNSEEKTLLLNGGRNRYLLKDQWGGNTGHYMIVEQIRKWAHGQQSSRAARERNKTAGPMAPKARQTRELIAKLERRANKIQINRPANICLPSKYDLEPVSEWERDHWHKWIEERPLRKQLSKFIRTGKAKQGRTWAQFYEELDKVFKPVMGYGISPSRYFSAVSQKRRHGRKIGPDWESYWKHLPEWLGLQTKPYRDRELGEGWSYAPERRLEYCAAVTERKSILGQIEDLKGLLEIYEKGLSAVQTEEL